MYILGALVVAIVLVLFALWGSGSSAAAAGAKAAPAAVVTAERAEAVRTASRAEMKERLLKLAKGEAPTELAIGAMCYEVAAPPLKAEYVCPKCGEKTLYALEDVDAQPDRQATWSMVSQVNVGIAASRRRIKEIGGLSVKLDESQFCRTCSPQVKTPKLGLVVQYAGQQEPHRVWDITENDAKLIAEFLAGKDKHVGPTDGEIPLKDYVKRLEELLGLRLDKPAE